MQRAAMLSRLGGAGERFFIEVGDTRILGR
jgi:hypothetical protein